jgi:hypothetical protein
MVQPELMSWFFPRGGLVKRRLLKGFNQTLQRKGCLLFMRIFSGSHPLMMSLEGSQSAYMRLFAAMSR